MKILHIVRQFYPCVGGIETFVCSLSQEQIQAGDTVGVLTLNRDFKDNSILPDKEKYKGINIRRIPFFGSKKYPLALSCIKYLNGYDLIHIHCVDFFIDYLVLLKFIHRKKIILHTHGAFFHTKYLRTFKKIYFNVVTRAVLNGCDKIIACSRHDYELFSKISRNVVQVDNGVNVKKYSAIKKDIKRGSLVYIGRIDENKRIDNLIRTTASLIKRGFEVRLKVIGPDWKGLRLGLQLLAKQLGVENNVLFLGKIGDEELVGEISRAHIFVSASEYESFGISAIEAMASGTICVLNSIETFKQFVSKNESGMVTDYANPKKAAGCIMRILNMNEEEYLVMGIKAREVAKAYSWDLAARKISEIYKEVTENRGTT